MLLAEFAANNAVNVATGYSPFFLNSGDHPILPTTILQGHGTSRVEVVQLMVERMKTTLEEAQALRLQTVAADVVGNRQRRSRNPTLPDGHTDTSAADKSLSADVWMVVGKRRISGPTVSVTDCRCVCALSRRLCRRRQPAVRDYRIRRSVANVGCAAVACRVSAPTSGTGCQ